jgi:glucose dehydrogenase
MTLSVRTGIVRPPAFRICQENYETSNSVDCAYHGTHAGAIASWTYDPELNLLYVARGNPDPVRAGQSRKGDDLYTASIVALNPDTGKLAWKFQVSPHDTHDWDATQVPVLVDDVVDRRTRKLLGEREPQRALLFTR